MKRKMYPIWLKVSALLVAAMAHGSLMAQTCTNPLDIHIANDISGSVDSREYLQSKDFVTQLALTVPLGNGLQQSRIGISQWSAGSNRFVEYVFPSAGATFTTSKSDIVSYINSARPFGGGTDPYTALLKAYEWVRQDPVSGRTGKPIIVLMTDAACSQIPKNLSSLATQVKNSGITIVVMAIDAASGCSALTGTQVASPNAYFSAATYSILQNNAITYISNMLTANCGPQTTAPDLTVGITGFEIINCNTTPSATANFTVTNNGTAAFSGTLDVAFYNGNPTEPNTQYLFTASSNQSFAANGGTYAGSTSNAALLNAATLYAVVNINGALAANAVPLRPNLSGATLTDGTEKNLNNNFSSAYTRTNGSGCTPYAQIDVQVSNSGQVCDNEIVYFVTVCNTGTADFSLGTEVDPTTGIAGVTAYPPAAYTFVSAQLVGTDPYISGKLPAGACANYNYTYSLANAFVATTYNFSVDVKEYIGPAPLPGNITLTGGIVHAIASIYDANYLPFTAPTGPANQSVFNPIGGNFGSQEPIIDVQGSLTTTGVTVRIPYTVVNAAVSLPAFSQTVNVPASLTQDGISRDVTLSWSAQSVPVGSGFINANLKAVAGTLNVDKLDVRNGLGDGSETIVVNSTGPVTRSVLGLLLANFTIPLNNVTGNTGQVHLRAITCQNDISLGSGSVVAMLYPYSGTYNTNDYVWCAREVTTAGFIWLDRNLGAYRLATSPTDAQSYGDLFQWGRKNDGHAKRVQRSSFPDVEGSSAQGVMVNTTTTNRSDVPPNARFIVQTDVNYPDWRVNPNDDLWNGVGAVNNPCPTGYRVPTLSECQALDDSWVSPSNGIAAAYSSPVKMTLAGQRVNNPGSVELEGQNGYYWTSSVNTQGGARWLLINTGAGIFNASRPNAFSVRCVKD